MTSLLNNDHIKSRINTSNNASPQLVLVGADIMPEQPNELKKLVNIATDLQLSADLRVQAIKLLGNIGTHEALLALLGLAGNDRLIKNERDLALKQARQIIKSGR